MFYHSRRGADLAAIALLTLAAAGCESEPTPPDQVGVGGLAIDSTVPVAGDLNSPFTGSALIYFDRALDPATVTEQNLGIVVALNAAALPGRVTYDDNLHAARLEIALVPGIDYQGVATVNVRGVGGEGLDAAFTWPFRARITERTAVDPTTTTGLTPVLQVDEAGVMHGAYVDGASGTVRYGRCAAACETPAGWSLVSVAAGAGAGAGDSRIDLAVSAGGEPAIAWYRPATGALAVSTCSAGCESAGAWQTVLLDDDAGDVGQAPSVARGPDGTLHAVYHDLGADDLRYTACPAGCGTAANWSPAIVLDGAGGRRGRSNDIAVDAAGHPHAAWVSDDDLTAVYGTCAAGCTTAAAWAVGAISGTAGSVTQVQLALGPDAPAILFGTTNLVGVGLCVSSDCADSGTWSLIPLLNDIANDARPSLAIDAAGRLHGIYTTDGGTVRYVTCTLGCANSPTRWVAGEFNREGNAVEAAVAVGPDGVPAALVQVVGGGLTLVR